MITPSCSRGRHGERLRPLVDAQTVAGTALLSVIAGAVHGAVPGGENTAVTEAVVAVALGAVLSAGKGEAGALAEGGAASDGQGAGPVEGAAEGADLITLGVAAELSQGGQRGVDGRGEGWRGGAASVEVVVPPSTAVGGDVAGAGHLAVAGEHGEGAGGQCSGRATAAALACVLEGPEVPSEADAVGLARGNGHAWGGGSAAREVGNEVLVDGVATRDLLVAAVVGGHGGGQHGREGKKTLHFAGWKRRGSGWVMRLRIATK